MGNLMSYSGMVTKIHAMRAKLLSEEDYENLAGLRSVPEIVEYLKGKPSYAGYVGQMDVSLYHRGNVEKILYQSLLDDYSKIFRFGTSVQKTFLKLYKKRYEVALITYCLRIVFNRYDRPFELEYRKQFFDHYSDISVDKLITSRNIEELVNNLAGTEYYEPLSRLPGAGEATLFDYDLTLELYYYSTIWKKESKLLKGKEKEAFLTRFGTEIDILNLQYIYRAKKYYNMLAPDIYALTIPHHYRLKLDEFKTLVETPTVEEFINKLQNTYYSRKYGMDDSRTMERKYKIILAKIYEKNRRRDPYSAASITEYLFLKEDEIYKLTTVLECVRYGLNRAETLGYLGGVV